VEITETLFFNKRSDWRAWLEKNHDKKKEVWLIHYKKHTGKTSIEYNDTVEEALCFGWIDSTLKRIDDEKHVIRFSPRNPNSIWSKSNITRVKKMIKKGKMTISGLEKYEYGMKKKMQAPSRNEKLIVPKDFQNLLREEPEAQ